MVDKNKIPVSTITGAPRLAVVGTTSEDVVSAIQMHGSHLSLVQSPERELLICRKGHCKFDLCFHMKWNWHLHRVECIMHLSIGGMWKPPLTLISHLIPVLGFSTAGKFYLNRLDGTSLRASVDQHYEAFSSKILLIKTFYFKLLCSLVFSCGLHTRCY